MLYLRECKNSVLESRKELEIFQLSGPKKFCLIQKMICLVKIIAFFVVFNPICQILCIFSQCEKYQFFTDCIINEFFGRKFTSRKNSNISYSKQRDPTDKLYKISNIRKINCASFPIHIIFFRMWNKRPASTGVLFEQLQALINFGEK